MCLLNYIPIQSVATNHRIQRQTTLRQLPSIITLERHISCAKRAALQVAMASAISIEKGRGIVWDKTAIISPSKSQTKTCK